MTSPPTKSLPEGPAFDRTLLRRALLRPATLVILIFNAIPIAGIAFRGWDLFLVLMLYWLETLVVGLWAGVRLSTLPVAAIEGLGGPAFGFRGRFASAKWAAFHLLFGLAFAAVQFLVLWGMFSGEWFAQVSGPREFVRVIVVQSGLWVPLAILFVGRGAGVVHAIATRPFGSGDIEPARAEASSVLSGFYLRIVVMQFAVILGAFAAQGRGVIAPLIILIAAKTLIELSIETLTNYSRLAVRSSKA